LSTIFSKKIKKILSFFSFCGHSFPFRKNSHRFSQVLVLPYFFGKKLFFKL